jgi:hypothetical protein
MQLAQDGQQSGNVQAIVTFLMVFAHMNILFIAKVKIIVFIDWSYVSSLVWLTNKLIIANVF